MPQPTSTPNPKRAFAIKFLFAFLLVYAPYTWILFIPGNADLLKFWITFPAGIPAHLLGVPNESLSIITLASLAQPLFLFLLLVSFPKHKYIIAGAALVI